MAGFDERFMHRAIELARRGMEEGDGGPFGSVVVKEGVIIGEGTNRVTSTNDPTAHAEVVAIREACRNLASFQLAGCDIYASCEPCPMCLSAIYWARADRVFFAGDRSDAARAGFDDDLIYRELARGPSDRQIKTEQYMQEAAAGVFDEWVEKPNKVRY